MTREQEIGLLEALGRGSRDAFAALYNAFAGRCYSFVESLVKDSQTAKDITHDIFMKVWLRREIISKVDSFSSYLYRMARNAVMDKFTSDTIRSRYASRQLLCQDEFKSYIDEKVSADELQMLIFKAVSRMPEQRKRIFTLSRYKGLTNAEIAESVGINIRTVENHITLALADIRMMLTESYKF